MKKRRVYLDNASTTPLALEVLRAMLPYLKQEYGNPANLYELGQRARRAVETARAQIAQTINSRPKEIIFTGSATEADNLALAGAAHAAPEKNQLIISAVEHKGIAAVAEALKNEGWKIIILPVDKNGTVNLAELKKSLNEKTVLVSVTMADSETGTLQPITEIARIIRHSTFSPLFHTDASQAATYAEINVAKLGVDLLTLSAHKLGGPKGVGALYVRSGVQLRPLIFGGGQQEQLRSGTENVPGIVGFGAAMAWQEKKKKQEARRLKKLRDDLERKIFKLIPKVILNGHPQNRLPNFLNLSFLDTEGEALLLYLDEAGIVVNTGSACNAENLKPSEILTALGRPYEFVHGSIRFSLGSQTKAGDINYVLAKLPKIVEKLRQISPLNLSLEQNEKTA